MSKVWFARVHSVNGPGGNYTPVSREGWFVVAGFVAAMVIGAVLFIGLMMIGQILAAIVLYAGIAIVAGGAFIWIAAKYGDKTRTAAEYRAMRATGKS